MVDRRLKFLFLGSRNCSGSEPDVLPGLWWMSEIEIHLSLNRNRNPQDNINKCSTPLEQHGRLSGHSHTQRNKREDVKEKKMKSRRGFRTIILSIRTSALI